MNETFSKKIMQYDISQVSTKPIKQKCLISNSTPTTLSKKILQFLCQVSSKERFSPRKQLVSISTKLRHFKNKNSILEF